MGAEDFVNPPSDFLAPTREQVTTMSESTSDLSRVQPEAARTKKAGGSKMLRMVLFVLGGAVLGFAYYRFVGCRTGTCPITSSPYISSLYGALMGLLLSRS